MRAIRISSDEPYSLYRRRPSSERAAARFTTLFAANGKMAIFATRIAKRWHEACDGNSKPFQKGRYLATPYLFGPWQRRWETQKNEG